MQTLTRLYITSRIALGETILGTPQQAHHLASVLRRAAGDSVRLFNGIDGEFAATISHLRRDALAVTPHTALRPQAREPDIWLLFALLKRDATDLVVEKATKLGVAAIHPVLSERTNAAQVNLDRLRSIATEAACQSERLTVPVLHAPRKLMDMLGDWPADRRLAAAPGTQRSPALAPGPTALLVGPEGGFTPRELDLLRAQPFIQPVSLGPRVLRADTATIAGLACYWRGRKTTTIAG